MIYKFKSAASGDVVMLGPQGDQLLRLLGREPAAQGIVEVAAMPQAIAALEAAIAGEASSPATDDDPDAVALKRRLWPMIEMLRRAQAGNAVVVWGV